MPEPTVKVRMKENARAVPRGKCGVGAHVIALGDVSVAEEEIAVAHTPNAFVKPDWDFGFASRSLGGFMPVIPEQDSTVFDLPGRSALHHDAGGQLTAGLNARSL